MCEGVVLGVGHNRGQVTGLGCTDLRPNQPMQNDLYGCNFVIITYRKVVL